MTACAGKHLAQRFEDCFACARCGLPLDGTTPCEDEFLYVCHECSTAHAVTPNQADLRGGLAECCAKNLLGTRGVYAPKRTPWGAGK